MSVNKSRLFSLWLLDNYPDLRVTSLDRPGDKDSSHSHGKAVDIADIDKLPPEDQDTIFNVALGLGLRIGNELEGTRTSKKPIKTSRADGPHYHFDSAKPDLSFVRGKDTGASKMFDGKRGKDLSKIAGFPVRKSLMSPSERDENLRFRKEMNEKRDRVDKDAIKNIERKYSDRVSSLEKLLNSVKTNPEELKRLQERSNIEVDGLFGKKSLNAAIKDINHEFYNKQLEDSFDQDIALEDLKDQISSQKIKGLSPEESNKEELDRRVESDLASSYLLQPIGTDIEPIQLKELTKIPEFNQGGIVKKYADGGRIEQLLEQARRAGLDVAENTPPQLPADVQERIEMQKVRDKLMRQGAAERPSGSVGIKKPKAPPMEDFEFQKALRDEMGDVSKKASPMMEKAKLQGSQLLPEDIDFSGEPKSMSGSEIRKAMASKGQKIPSDTNLLFPNESQPDLLQKSSTAPNYTESLEYKRDLKSPKIAAKNAELKKLAENQKAVEKLRAKMEGIDIDAKGDIKYPTGPNADLPTGVKEPRMSQQLEFDLDPRSGKRPFTFGRVQEEMMPSSKTYPTMDELMPSRKNFGKAAEAVENINKATNGSGFMRSMGSIADDVSDFLRPRGVKKVANELAGFLGPAVGVGLAMSSGDAQAGLGELMGGSEAVGEGSDIIPNRPIHDVEIEKALQDRPELLMKFRRAKALKEMSPDMKKKLKPELYADGGIPGLSIGETGEEEYINQDQQVELDAAGRGDLEQGILDESGPLAKGVVASEQEVKRDPSQQSELLKRYEELVKQATTDKKDPEYDKKLKTAQWVDALGSIANTYGRYVLGESPGIKTGMSKSIMDAQSIKRKSEKDKLKQKIELFNMYKGLVGQQQAEQYKQDKFAFEKDRFAAEEKFKKDQQKINELYKNNLIDESKARQLRDQSKQDFEQKKYMFDKGITQVGGEWSFDPTKSAEYQMKQQLEKDKQAELEKYDPTKTKEYKLHKAKQELKSKPDGLSFEEKERKKAAIKDEFKQKEEAREVERNLKKDQKKKVENRKAFVNETDEVLRQIDEAIKLTRNSWWGSMGEVAGKFPTVAEDTAKVKQAYGKISFDNFVKKAKGMSKAFDSEKERELYEITQPNMNADQGTNLKNLKDMRAKILRERDNILQETGKKVKTKFYSPSRNQTKFIYDDGSEELKDGKL